MRERTDDQLPWRDTAIVPVSVIIPNYNSGTYLEECIASINGEAPPGEILVVDDVSSDGSLALALDLAAEHENVRVIRRAENGGSAEARRTGLTAATYDWIAFVDADDYVEPNAVAIAYGTAVREACDLCIWPMWRSERGVETPHLTPPSEAFPIRGREAVLLTLGEWKIPVLGVAKKEVYLRAYSGFQETSCNADELISRLALLNAGQVTTCDKKYFYRANPSSSSRTLHSKRLGELESQLWLIAFSERLSVGNRVMRKVVRSSIGNAWYLWSRRGEIGVPDTLEALRRYVDRLMRTGKVGPWILRWPKHAAALAAIGLHTRLTRQGGPSPDVR